MALGHDLKIPTDDDVQSETLVAPSWSPWPIQRHLQAGNGRLQRISDLGKTRINNCTEGIEEQ